VLRRLPALELISFTGTGAATFVDLPAARDCGIAVANVARYGDAAVAEHALAPSPPPGNCLPLAIT
jgi:D-3-phosphoglycerate dehydrogenase